MFGKLKVFVYMIYFNLSKRLNLFYINNLKNQKNVVKVFILENIQRVFLSVGFRLVYFKFLLVMIEDGV